MLGALELQIAVADVGRQILPFVARPVDEVSRGDFKAEVLKGSANRKPIGDIERAGDTVTVDVELELLVLRRLAIDAVTKQQAIVLVPRKRTIGVTDKRVRLAEWLAPVGQTTNSGVDRQEFGR